MHHKGDTMFQRMGLTDEDMVVDPQLGYPRGYAKLCRRSHIQMPYDHGPPHTFLPYTLHPLTMLKLKEMNQLFPTNVSEETDPLDTRKYVDFLWKQLDHLGNAGFDPAKFRVDPYGNVLYFHADPASPLAWEVDHWFPYSRGGKTVPSNLRLVQWQVHNTKRDQLEFLMPWWDLQLGVSVNQFLSTFASNFADFRQRAFSLLFFAGENEQLDEITVVDCHSWPQHFLEKRRQFGLAPAAIVRVQKDTDDTLKPLNITQPTKPDSGRRWSVEEDEALCRAIQKFRPRSTNETKELEPVLVSKSTAQVRGKFRLRKGDWELDKENMGDLNNIHMAFSTALEKETSLKLKREEEILHKQQEIALLDQELMQLKQRNEAERLVLEDLESLLRKHRRRVEKHRHLAETQASYRQCMEKMIRDIMHQSIVYKEQLRLNQAACNALMARLESLKANSDKSEREFLKKFKQREDIQALLRPYSEQIRKRLREDDTASCCKSNVKEEADPMPPGSLNCIPGNDDKESCRMPLNKTTNLLKDMEESSKRIQKELRLFLEEDQEASRAEILLDAHKEQDTKGVEKKTATKKSRLLELEASEVPAMIVGHEYQDAKAESIGDNAKEDGPCEAGGEEDLDDMLQQVITMQGEAEAAMADANAEEVQEEEEERIRRIGKSNLDKWLQMLLQNTQAGVFVDEAEGKSKDVLFLTAEEVDDAPTGLFGELQKKQSFNQPETEHAKLPSTQGAEEQQERTKRTAGKVQQSLNLEPLRCKEEEDTGVKEKERFDAMDLSENFHGLNLECNDEVDAELCQQHNLEVAMRVKIDAGIQKKKKKTETIRNSDPEFHKKDHKAAAIIRNSDSEFQKKEHKAAAPAIATVLENVSQQQERMPDNHTIDQMVEGVALGNTNAYDSLYQTDHKAPGGTIIRSSGIEDPTVQKAGENGNNGDNQVLQQKGKAARLKRSHSMRVRPGFVPSAAASPAFWWGDHRGGYGSGTKMWVFGQDGENEEEEGGGRIRDLKRSGEDHIKIGMKASIRSCTRAWKRTVKKGGRLSEPID